MILVIHPKRLKGVNQRKEIPTTKGKQNVLEMEAEEEKKKRKKKKTC